jgi:hypothetical protein
VRNSKEKRSLGRHRSRWEDNIEMDLQDVEWGLDWIGLAQNTDRCRALTKAVMILCVI